MVNIYFLGTCSGTEPKPDAYHSSFVIECDGDIFWFDAGEGCSRRAFLDVGLDIMKTKAIFVSHPHIDHIGGLANLLFLFDKLERVHGKRFEGDNSLELYFPDMNLLPAIVSVAKSGRVYDFAYGLNTKSVKEGVLYDNGRVKITALSNTHLGADEADRSRSFSYLFEAEGKKIVFSGDLKRPSEIDTLLVGGADVLIMETGHHKVLSVLEYAKEHGVKTLVYNHHGREMLTGREEFAKIFASDEVRSEINALIGFDCMKLTV